MRAGRLDPVDETILPWLVADARRSYADIGGRVGLTASAVKRRVDRLRAQIGAQPFVVRTKSVLVLSALLRRPVTPRRDEP